MRAVLAGQPGGGRVVQLIHRYDSYFYACPDCPFERTYGTRKGAAQSIAEHALQVHGVQLLFSEGA